MDRENVRKETQEILEKFDLSLEKIKSSKTSHHIFREVTERKENGKSYINFKEHLLENASNKNEDFILTEKGDWKS